MASAVEVGKSEWGPWALAVFMVLVLMEVAPRIGGWVLLLVTVGLAVRAHQKGLV